MSNLYEKAIKIAYENRANAMIAAKKAADKGYLDQAVQAFKGFMEKHPNIRKGATAGVWGGATMAPVYGITRALGGTPGQAWRNAGIAGGGVAAAKATYDYRNDIKGGLGKAGQAIKGLFDKVKSKPAASQGQNKPKAAAPSTPPASSPKAAPEKKSFPNVGPQGEAGAKLTNDKLNELKNLAISLKQNGTDPRISGILNTIDAHQTGKQPLDAEQLNNLFLSLGELSKQKQKMDAEPKTIVPERGPLPLNGSVNWANRNDLDGQELTDKVIEAAQDAMKPGSRNRADVYNKIINLANTLSGRELSQKEKAEANTYLRELGYTYPSN